MARRLQKQQAGTAVNKLHDPKTNQTKYEPKDIEKIFRDYYKELYSQTTIDHRDTKIFLDSLDLSSIGKVQNEHITVLGTKSWLNSVLAQLELTARQRILAYM